MGDLRVVTLRRIANTSTMSMIAWNDVTPATLTQFNADLAIDHILMSEHSSREQIHPRLTQK